MWPEIQLPSSLEETTPDPAIRSEFEDGSVHTRPRYTRLRRTWTLTWQNLKGADYRTLRAFYVSQKGGSLTFTWQNPIERTTFTVRFTGDITAKYTEVDHWNVTVRLEEV